MALAPVLTITGCSDDKSSAAEKKTADMAGKAAAVADDVTDAATDAAGDAVVKAADEVKEAVKATADKASGLVTVQESDSLAKSLGYKHSVDDVNVAKYPQRQAGNICANCILYQGNEACGPCSIFVGKLVNANGWCATYAHRS